MGWVGTVIAAAERVGVPLDLLLAQSGLPADALRAEFWEVDQITRLWHAAEQCSGDPGFGLKVGAGVNLSSISALGFTLLSAATLRDALTMLQKYQALISDGGRFQMLLGSQTTWVVYHPQQGRLAFSPHQIEAVLAAVVTLGRWMTGRALKPNRLQFSQARLGPLRDYLELFACPVDFQQAFSGLLLDNGLLDEPLPQADARLARVHEDYTSTHLLAIDAGRVAAPDLHEWIAANLAPQPPRRRQAAQALGLSESTLARRLRAQGWSFDELLDEVRREKALLAVREGRRELAEVALSLGFAEASSFYRAFTRWTGLPPVKWRRRQVGEDI